MNSSSQECRMKALELLASEFSNKKYGQFVKKEIEALESGLKEEIGFQSESDDVVLDITLNGCFISYDYWDNTLSSYVKGSGRLSYEYVVKQIINAIENY